MDNLTHKKTLKMEKELFSIKMANYMKDNFKMI